MRESWAEESERRLELTTEKRGWKQKIRVSNHSEHLNQRPRLKRKAEVNANIQRVKYQRMDR
jgi:hypothetical protein